MGSSASLKKAKSFTNNESLIAKPILKWAGGKSQMLEELLLKVPSSYGRYIEPFFGGGALFFALNPKSAVISDSNPELINVYKQVAANVEEVIEFLGKYENTSEMFYSVRNQDWHSMSEAEAAARTIFLNKTCFNGLYRVNKNGQFNVPYGKYKNPRICDPNVLRAASLILRKAEIVCDDYVHVLEHYARPGDFIFLDPPYLPISKYSDFKRYTKEQFHEQDHIVLANMVKKLHEKGCHVLLTNSNHPLVHKLYSSFRIDVIQTRRHISCNGQGRRGEDVIVSAPIQNFQGNLMVESLPQQVTKYPSTRFMGSKSKLLSEIWSVASRFNVETVVDLFSGSGIVGYMFKTKGKRVISNDYMMMSATFTKAMVENNEVTLPLEEARELLINKKESDHFVSKTFKGLYFSDEENELIDTLRTNISAIQDQYKRAIAMTALIRACTKKRPRGIFTYTGQRYDDGRKDLKKSIGEHFIEAVASVNEAIFNNGKQNKSICGDAMNLYVKDPDLIYLDPPYYTPLSDNEYVRRYHFVEGLARDWQGVEIQLNTKTKKFKSYPTPFSTKQGARGAFDQLFNKFQNSILVVSYSSNSLPSKDEMISLMLKYKKNVKVIPIDHKYSFGNQSNAKTHRNSVQEYLFVGY